MDFMNDENEALECLQLLAKALNNDKEIKSLAPGFIPDDLLRIVRETGSDQSFR